jgi:hypothetical protein
MCWGVIFLPGIGSREGTTPPSAVGVLGVCTGAKAKSRFLLTHAELSHSIRLSVGYLVWYIIIDSVCAPYHAYWVPSPFHSVALQP